LDLREEVSTVSKMTLANWVFVVAIKWVFVLAIEKRSSRNNKSFDHWRQLWSRAAAEMQ